MYLYETRVNCIVLKINLNSTHKHTVVHQPTKLRALNEWEFDNDCLDLCVVYDVCSSDLIVIFRPTKFGETPKHTQWSVPQKSNCIFFVCSFWAFGLHILGVMLTNKYNERIHSNYLRFCVVRKKHNVVAFVYLRWRVPMTIVIGLRMENYSGAREGLLSVDGTLISIRLTSNIR